MTIICLKRLNFILLNNTIALFVREWNDINPLALHANLNDFYRSIDRPGLSLNRKFGEIIIRP